MFQGIINLLQNAKRVGIFAHENPDGDALGSGFSLKLILQEMGKEAEVYLASKSDLAAYNIVKGKEPSGLLPKDCDLLVAVDCAEIRRLGTYAEFFASHPNTAAVDHHVTHIPFAKETVVQDVSSCCEIMADLYEAMGCSITPSVATNLYMGMICDTGRFQYQGVTGKTLQRAAGLIESGVPFAEISKAVFQTKTREYYSLMQKALEKLSFHQDGRVCALYLSQKDFEDANLDESGAVGIVTIPSSIEGVLVGIYIREREPESYKVSLRSDGQIDVATIAAALGGGGHRCASGFSGENQTVPQLIEAVIREMKKQEDGGRA